MAKQDEEEKFDELVAKDGGSHWSCSGNLSFTVRLGGSVILFTRACHWLNRPGIASMIHGGPLAL